MRNFNAMLLALAVLAAGPVARSAPEITEGKQYSLLDPAQPTEVGAGKVEVTEVFSYACPACDRFYPLVEGFKAGLAANVVFDYLPAGFIPAEDWPMFQRAYCTAQVLGIADRTHVAMFKAVWGTGELATIDQQTQRIKSPAPTIEDAARFYARVAGVKESDFLAAAKSFAVDLKVKRADQLVAAYKVLSTPTLIINGKYRVDPMSAGSYEQMLVIARALIAKETLAAGARPK